MDEPTIARAGGALKKYGDWVLGLGVLGLVITLVSPVPPAVLDVLLAFNITASLLLLLVTMNSKAAVEMSVFPTLLLFATLVMVVALMAAQRFKIGRLFGAFLIVLYVIYVWAAYAGWIDRALHLLP